MKSTGKCGTDCAASTITTAFCSWLFFAISLTGEPTLYPKLPELIKEIHSRGKTSFLVTNGQHPEVLQKLKIDHIIHQPISELSGGQQQRVSIARVLFKKPKIIFADEPTGNLDKRTAIDVMNVLIEYILQANGALLLVTHDEEVANMCNQKYYLKNGRLDV